MRILCVAVGIGLSGLGLLTVFRSPDWVDWRIAILAGQFGYLAAAVPLCGCVTCALLRPRDGMAVAGFASCAAAALLLLQPCAQAWLIGRALPARLSAAFGPAEVSASPFALSGLFRRRPRVVPHSAMEFAPGLQLDFYPAKAGRPAPCIVMIHGGGWDGGSRGEIATFTDAIASWGYAVADVSYRLAPASKWPAQRGDIASAIAFLKANSGRLGIDAGRLVLAGRSAGGQIAEACAYGFHDPAIRGVIGLYAPADMRFAWKWGRADDALNSPHLLRQFLGGTPESAGAAYDSASGITMVTASSPPTLLIHGTIDTLVWCRHSEHLSERLTQAGVPNLLVEMPWATHALEYNPDSPSGQLASYCTAWFLAAVCR